MVLFFFGFLNFTFAEDKSTKSDRNIMAEIEYRNEIMKEASNYIKTVSRLRAAFNYRQNIIQSLNDNEAKSSQVYELVKSLTWMISGADMSIVSFFLVTQSEAQIPFTLLGMETPDSVKGIGVSEPVDYISYLDAHKAEIFNKKDPTILVNDIGINLERIIQSADLAFTNYLKHAFRSMDSGK